MANKIAAVLKNENPESKSVYTMMKHRSDGDILKGDGPPPTTPADHKIHNGHIIDSGEYNVAHSYGHLDELAFDYKRLKKADLSKDAEQLKAQTMRILNPVVKKMGLKLKETT